MSDVDRLLALSRPALASWVRANVETVEHVLDSARESHILLRMQTSSPSPSRSSKPRARVFLATLPDGQVVKRTTESHDYPFVVVSTRTQAEADARLKRADAALARVPDDRRASHAALVAASRAASEAYKVRAKVVEAEGRQTYQDAEHGRLLNIAVHKSDAIRKHPDARVLGWDADSPPYPMHRDAEACARDVGTWRVIGWTSRRDLADKLAAKEKAEGKYGTGHPLRDVRVLATTEKA